MAMALSGYRKKCGGEPSDVTVRVNGGLELQTRELGIRWLSSPASCGGVAVRLPSVL